MGILDSDVGVYVAGGVVMSLCFIVALGIVAAMPTLQVTRGTILTFGAGFAISISVYYLALWVYAFVDDDEDPKRYAPEDGDDPPHDDEAT